MDYPAARLCSILYLASGMGLHYLTFMERNLEKEEEESDAGSDVRKKWTSELT